MSEGTTKCKKSLAPITLYQIIASEVSISTDGDPTGRVGPRALSVSHQKM